MLCLLSNAIKFTKHGFVKVRVSIDKVSDEFESLVVEIQDSGEGMDRSTREKVDTLLAPRSDAHTTLG